MALGHAAKILEPDQWEAELVDKSTEFFGHKGNCVEEFKAVFAHGRGKGFMQAAKQSGIQRIIDKGTDVMCFVFYAMNYSSYLIMIVEAKRNRAGLTAAICDINLSIGKAKAETAALLNLPRGAEAALVTLTMNATTIARTKIRLHGELKKGSDTSKKINLNTINTMNDTIEEMAWGAVGSQWGLRCWTC